MTEAEWQTSSAPQSMLDALLLMGVPERKLRLFACACVRRFWPWVRDPRCRLAVEVAEHFADRAATVEELQVAHHAAREATRRFGGARHPAEFAARDAAGFDAFAAARDAARRAIDAARDTADDFTWVFSGPDFPDDRFRAAALAAEQDQCRILRDLLGSPFGPPVVFDRLWADWNGGAARRLAEAIHAGRRFDDLPVLADALEEAGCRDARVLAHCRGGGEHFRGCWVVDLVLARE